MSWSPRADWGGLPGPRHPGRAAAERGSSDTGVAIDLATHDLDIMQHVLGLDDQRDLRRRRPLPHSSQEDLLTCLARFNGTGAGRGPARRQLADPREEARGRADRRERPAARELHNPGRLVRRVRRPRRSRWDGLSVLRGDGEGAAVRFSLAKAEPLHAELKRSAAASSMTRRSRSPRTTVSRPLPRRLRCASRPPCAARSSCSTSRLPAPLEVMRVIRFVIPAYNEAENIPRLLADLAPRGARVRRPSDRRRRRLDRRNRRGGPGALAGTCTWQSSPTPSTAASAPR